MRASCDYHPWYPNVDPDFDEMGGELTLQQIADPLPGIDEEPRHYFARVRVRKDEQARYRRHVALREALRAAKLTAHKQNLEDRYRLLDLTARFAVAARSLNAGCRGCIPYNGHLTPRYWEPAQAPYKVEAFLR
jgi:hypothetical protein